jgi:hypothetical protein
MTNSTQSIQKPFNTAVMDDEDMAKIMEALAYNGDSMADYAKVFAIGQQHDARQPTGAFGS